MQRPGYDVDRKIRWRNPRAAGVRVALALAVLQAFLVFARPAHSEAVDCEGHNIAVHARSPRDARLACAGAIDALRFFRSLGLRVKAPVTLRIVGSFPKGVDSSACGYYSYKDRCAYLLSFAELEKRGTPFDLPVDATLYRSMATHEVAHVIAARNFAIPRPPIMAKEYIAYVAMFAAMPEVYRRRLFSKFPVRAFDDEADISTMHYLMNPTQFGVRAYKHFMKPMNGPAFIRRVLAGRALSSETIYY